MKVYTKTGDQGETSLLSKERVPKDHCRVEAYGTVDEAGSAMGLARALTQNAKAADIIYSIQRELISLNADLATGKEIAAGQRRITESSVREMELLIDALETERIPRRGFVIPGESPAGAALDVARTIVRRAERSAIRLKRSGGIVPQAVLLYLNRLSDLLFVLARWVEQEELVTAVTGRIMAAGHEAGGKSEQPNMLEKAKQMIAAAEQKALVTGVPMVIAVVDGGGNLVAQHRMDGALLASIAIALDKAYTAVALKMPTSQAAALTLPGQPLFGLHTVQGGRYVVFGGGIPIAADGCVIGGIGVSGGSVEEDMAVAEAGLAAW